MKNSSGFEVHSRYLLVHGIAAAKAGEKEQAYKYLERYLYQDPPQKELMDAMYYLSLVSPEEAEQREWVEKILAIDPTEGRARRRLAILNGDLVEKDIIDPDRLQPQTTQTVFTKDLDRFVCEKCGGRMTFAPDGHTLVCEHCEMKSYRNPGKQNINEGNFLLAMATGKGHLTSINLMVSHCSGCGAEFMIPADHLSWQCPYCESNYSVVEKEEKEVVYPEAIIPFKLTREQAQKKLYEWWNAKAEATTGKFEALLGVYWPMWTFDIGGFIDWQIEINENRRWYMQSSSSAIFYDDVRVSGTKKCPTLLKDLIESYEFKDLIAFDPMYLANWMAENYEVTAGDAAINARKMALEAERSYLAGVQTQQYRNLHLSSSRISVEQYKLVLMPVWHALLVLGAERFPVMINGQTGDLFSSFCDEDKDNWFSKIFSWID